MKLDIKSVNYQRNGVAGEGFFAVRFDWKDELGKNRRMIATVFVDEDENGDYLGSEYYGVVDIDEPLECWRGDNFVAVLFPAIVDYASRT